MNKRTWLIVGGLALVTIVVGMILKSRTSATDGSQSQLPASENEANYTVPPDIGMSTDNTGGVNLPTGGNVTLTTGQGNSLPITPYS
jgi:hypothetical protein